MKRITYLSIILFAAISLVSCKKTEQPSLNHLLDNEAYRQKVQAQFEKRTQDHLLNQEVLATVNNPKLSIEQKEALEFLYAYMPLSDLADYDAHYFLGQVNSAFQARDEFAWGKTIPKDIFRHFVLVSRVNNENLDTARQVFFAALKDRVKGMSMEQAALEVNHWCHENVTYRGTDDRTSAPLALQRTSWGRCGEESTFTTVALRSVGIPARQCYTPRWAHTDDNHAWVEVWVDGKWHYLGACEPDAKLDVAWFTAPAKRAMMVHSRAFGAYEGSEPQNETSSLYSVLNLLSNYASTRTAKVIVEDAQGTPVPDATVKFKVYNYSELYPIVILQSGKDGSASILTGKGDLMIWVNKGSQFGYAKMSSTQNELVVKLDRTVGKSYQETTVLVPPVEQSVQGLSQEEIKKNALRLTHEDSIRSAYMSTFITEAAAKQFAKANGLDADQTWHYLNRAQGNWKEIQKLMQAQKDNSDLFAFLASLSEKDVRDTPCDYLLNHLNVDKSKISKSLPASVYVPGILSAHINNELIRPWRTYLQEQLKSIPALAHPTAQSLRDYVMNNIALDSLNNFYRAPLSPQGSFELKRADAISRNILYVALCRAAYIPARIDQATGGPQVYDGAWKDVIFEKGAVILPKASIQFKNNPSNIVHPKYYANYTIARFQDGDYVTLDYENNKDLQTLPGTVSVDAGFYRLMVGTRANDGSVTYTSSYFEIKPKEKKVIELTLPKIQKALQVLGTLDMNTPITLKDGKIKTLKELANNKGIFLCFADPNKEPTKHILQEIPGQKAFFEKWQGGVVFIVPSDKLSSAFNAKVFANLPKQSLWGVDKDRTFLKSVVSLLGASFTDNFPLSLYISTQGNVLFLTQGYRIGISEDVMKTIIEQESCCTKP